MAKEAFAARVPEADDACFVGEQDAVRCVGEKASLEIWNGHGQPNGTRMMVSP
jgi:hypothetical protein